MGSTKSSESEGDSLSKKGLSILIFGGFLFTAAIWLLFVAAGVYWVIYHFYIPPQELRLPLYFTNTTTVFDLDLMKTPLSAVDYSFNLNLEIPRSERNKDTGNFLVSVYLTNDPSTAEEMQLPIHETKPSSRKHRVDFTGIVPYMSPLLEAMHTITFAPLLVFGLMKQTSVLGFELFDNVNFKKHKLNYAIVRIHQLIDVEKAYFVWKPKLKGLRYLMLNYPVLSFFAGTLFVWFWELAVTFGTVLYIRLQMNKSAEAPEPNSLDTVEGIQVPRRSVSRRQPRASPLATSFPRDTPNLSTRTWAPEARSPQVSVDTSLFSPRSETAGPDETPATALEDFDESLDFSADTDTPARSTGVLPSEKNAAINRKRS